MASNRHLGRVIAFQTLYEQEFRLDAEDKKFDLDEVLNRNMNRYKGMVEDTDFVEKLVKGVNKEAEKLDASLQPIAPEWPIDQISRMDRIILRMGLYELTFFKDTPTKVVINEAVELAKSFGGDNSSKFVNGVLGTIYKNTLETEEKVKIEKPKKKPAAKPVAKTAVKPATKPKKAK